MDGKGRVGVRSNGMCRLVMLASLLLLLGVPVQASSIGTFRETDSEGASKDTQMGCGLINSVSYDGGWKILVHGNTTVAVGAGEALYQFVFAHPRTGKEYDSSLLTAAYPVSGETEQFYQNWRTTVEYMTDYLYSVFGDSVNFVSHDNLQQTRDSNVYVFYFELWNEDKTQVYPITVTYRFAQSYYMFAIGVNLGDLPEVFWLAKQAAVDFRDYSSAPNTGEKGMYFSGNYQHTLPAWKYDVVNPFQVVMEYFEA